MAHQVRGSARIAAATLVMMMVTIMPLLFHYCEAATAGTVAWAIPAKPDWAVSKKFKVNDLIQFNFASGTHNLVKVTPQEYKSCLFNANPKVISIKTTTVKLAAAETSYYVCTVPGHCSAGMKVNITATATK